MSGGLLKRHQLSSQIYLADDNTINDVENLLNQAAAQPAGQPADQPVAQPGDTVIPLPQDIVKVYGQIPKPMPTPPTISTVCYIMLRTDNYQRDIVNLCKTFYDNNPQLANGSGLNSSQIANLLFVPTNQRPPLSHTDMIPTLNPHMTLLQFDIQLNDQDVRKLSNNQTSLQRIINSCPAIPGANQGKNCNDWDHFSQNILEPALHNYLRQKLLKEFKGVPDDTTVSCYPSRYTFLPNPPVDGKPCFGVVKFRSDLGFNRIIIPNLIRGVQEYFQGQGQGYIEPGPHYKNLDQIKLHISITKESKKLLNHPNRAGKLNQINQLIDQTVAKNFKFSPNDFTGNNDILWVSIGSWFTQIA